MFQKETDSPYWKHDGERVYQGDILRDVSLVVMKSSDEAEDDYIIEEITIPYVVVFTQDCDLNEDFKNRGKISEKQDKYLGSILVCPAYQAEFFREGKHLEKFKLTMEKWNSVRYQPILKQNNIRFHYLKGYQPFQIPELIIDFKHYYTIPRDITYFLMKHS